jgi:hypothetical protein
MPRREEIHETRNQGGQAHRGMTFYSMFGLGKGRQRAVAPAPYAVERAADDSAEPGLGDEGEAAR